jgi:hypothetical protein
LYNVNDFLQKSDKKFRNRQIVREREMRSFCRIIKVIKNKTQQYQQTSDCNLRKDERMWVMPCFLQKNLIKGRKALKDYFWNIILCAIQKLLTNDKIYANVLFI